MYNLASNGLLISEPFYPGRLALGLPMPSGVRIQNMTCTIATNSSSDASLVNINGSAITSSIVVNYAPPTCNLKDIAAFVNITDTINQYAMNIQNNRQLFQLNSLLTLVGFRESLQGFFLLMNKAAESISTILPPRGT
jgi:hypothetical protein